MIELEEAVRDGEKEIPLLPEHILDLQKQQKRVNVVCFNSSYMSYKGLGTIRTVFGPQNLKNQKIDREVTSTLNVATK